ncbi:hypothetical protein H4R21_003645 [Coemansia helicoidea]|uniref:Uncharacterized protein n=1 Tax=Coemansia helicoidea TaxID=1286919 RepID=A0ACC1L1P2_9FUNG|nr:hypothetical protein H4R21_003645 [Coemansia helicoidea]
MASACALAGAADARRSPPRRLAWAAKLDAPGVAIDATAALLPLPDSPQHAAAAAATALPPWPGSRLRLLTLVQLDSVPPALFAAAAFELRINAGDDDSRRYANGLVARLLRPQAAALARIEGAGPPLPANDPFVDPPAAECSSLRLPTRPLAVVYAEHAPSTRLVLHFLDSRPAWLESLAAAAQDAPPSDGDCARAPDGLACEHAFVAHLALQSQAERQARMARTLSAENMVIGGATPLGRKTSSTSRGIKKMTLSEIEDFAGGPSGTASDRATSRTLDAPSPEVEQANKKLAKQLVIASLKERGIGRDHHDFAALWGQIYRSLKFALRATLPCRPYAVRELRAEVEKHARFYCTS